MQRACDFESRRKHLADLSDQALKERLWELAFDIVKPLSDLAYAYTSPSIERSVLLRMGFSSLEAQSIVSFAEKRGLLGKGAGNLVLRYARATSTDYLTAGKRLSAGTGWDHLFAPAGKVGGGSK